MLISHMEGRPEWPLIVQSVVCPTCGASADQPCINLSAASGTLAAKAPRNDWHQERKLVAVTEWDAFRHRVGAKEPDACVTDFPGEICDGSGSERYTDFVDTGFAQDGEPYGIRSEYTTQAPQNVDYIASDGLTDEQRGTPWGSPEHLEKITGNTAYTSKEYIDHHADVTPVVPGENIVVDTPESGLNA